MGGTKRHDQLLQAVVEDVQANGLANRSLRGIAARIGTSHRMLIHHFGSREGLLTEVVRAVDADQRRFWESIGPMPGSMDRIWERLAEPRQRAATRLFFECYLRACQGEEPFARLLPGIITDWMDALVGAGLVGEGPELVLAARARLGIAVFRGLLLDLVATDDRAVLDTAIHEFQALVEGARSASG